MARRSQEAAAAVKNRVIERQAEVCNRRVYVF